MPLNPVPTNYDLLVERLVNMSSDRFPVNTAKLTIWEVNEFLDRIKYPNSVDIRLFFLFSNFLCSDQAIYPGKTLTLTQTQLLAIQFVLI
uniref:Uncharacterized protein n=1 Tax=Meloidogyne incognita TaxID=6306 RepID=A0A914M7R8_MELIC